jgi:hypothetical protein
MVELNMDDIIGRLHDLAAYSPALAQRNEDEHDLPEDPALWLADKIERALARVEQAALFNSADAADSMDELGKWLKRSYEYYMIRLRAADTPWCFRFPKAGYVATHISYAQH